MWNVENHFRIRIGGLYFSDVPNLIVAAGESLFRVKRREEDGLLGIDFDVYRDDGTKVATIRNAHVVSGNADDYSFKKEKHRYIVIERSSGKTICDVRQVTKANGEEIAIDVDLYTKSGFHLIATPESTNIPGRGVMSGVHITGFAGGLHAP